MFINIINFNEGQKVEIVKFLEKQQERANNTAVKPYVTNPQAERLLGMLTLLLQFGYEFVFVEDTVKGNRYELQKIR